jgi:hypothetical protein
MQKCSRCRNAEMFYSRENISFPSLYRHVWIIFCGFILYLYLYSSTTPLSIQFLGLVISVLHPSGMQNQKVTAERPDSTSQHKHSNIQWSTTHLSTLKICLSFSIFVTGLVTWMLWVDGTFFHLPGAVKNVLPRPMVMLAFLWLQWIGFSILDFAG